MAPVLACAGTLSQGILGARHWLEHGAEHAEQGHFMSPHGGCLGHEVWHPQVGGQLPVPRESFHAIAAPASGMPYLTPTLPVPEPARHVTGAVWETAMEAGRCPVTRQGEVGSLEGTPVRGL